MIEPEKREAIYYLHQKGMSIREISRRLHVSRNSIVAIIKQKGSMPDKPRRDKIIIDEHLLGTLYDRCNGWVQRIHEILTEEKGINIGYSTLTRRIAELGLGQTKQSKNQRCAKVPDKPGQEMQHDTSIYTLPIDNKALKVVCSILYFRYSKMRYVKFYRSFDRFKMKCFLHEALTFFGFTASVCIIDNTNLARLRGSGQTAVIVPEMETFAKQYGFVFVCHEIGHSNRKAGNERSFYTVESNFFPGRIFRSLEDLNRQALEWATVRLLHRRVSKTGLIPAKAFEHEQSYLKPLAPYIQPPYKDHKRRTDQYGYISFSGNYYWIPGTRRDDVKVLQYSDVIKIYHQRNLLVEYQLPPAGVKNQQFSPQGSPGKGKPHPSNKPRYRKKPTAWEEQKLRNLSREVDAYLDFALSYGHGMQGKPKHRLIRQLYGLSQKMVLPLFIQTIQRALKYRITDIQTIERIGVLQMRVGDYQCQQDNVELSMTPIDENFQHRESYLQGLFSDDVDLSRYDKMMEADHEDHED